MSNAIQMKLEELNQIHPLDIVEDNTVEKKFISMYNAIWGTDIGEQIYNREKFNFNKILRENPALQECTKISIFGCFLDIAVNGLTLDQSGRPQCYITPSSVKIKGKNGDYWEKRASITVSAYGEIYMRQRAGQVKHVDNPVVVYEGDIFEACLDETGAKKIRYTARFPRTSNKPVAAFVRITRCDGTVDYHWMMESDWQRLAKYSEKKNKTTGANKLYSSNNGTIDTGFLENKVMKHAFDSYPKVRTGQYTVMETETEEPVIDYGIITEGDHVNEPINDSNIPFGEEKQLNAPEPVAPTITEADEEEGF